MLQSDIDKIKLTLEHMDQEAFEIAVDTILKAKRIYIVGIRSCAPLASFLSFYLNLIFDNVHLLQTNSASELFEQMIRIDEKDVIIGISFPRYSMRTLKAMEFANKRSAKVITLTDSIHSPMNLYSSCNLIARSDMASHCGLSGGASECSECAGCGTLYEKAERGSVYAGIPGRNLG